MLLDPGGGRGVSLFIWRERGGGRKGSKVDCEERVVVEVLVWGSFFVSGSGARCGLGFGFGGEE